MSDAKKTVNNDVDYDDNEEEIVFLLESNPSLLESMDREEILRRVPLIIFGLFLAFILISSMIWVVIFKKSRLDWSKCGGGGLSKKTSKTPKTTPVASRLLNNEDNNNNKINKSSKENIDYLLDSPILMRKLRESNLDAEAQQKYVQKYRLEYLYEGKEVLKATRRVNEGKTPTIALTTKTPSDKDNAKSNLCFRKQANSSSSSSTSSSRTSSYSSILASNNHQGGKSSKSQPRVGATSPKHGNINLFDTVLPAYFSYPCNQIRLIKFNFKI